MNYLEAGHEPTAFISSESSLHQDLVKVKYTRVDANSPEFATLYENVNQSVDVEFSTVVLRAQPEPVVAIYDFMMSTFVPQKSAGSPPIPSDKQNQAVISPNQPPLPPSQTTEQIRVNVNLQGVQGD